MKSKRKSKVINDNMIFDVNRFIISKNVKNIQDIIINEKVKVKVKVKLILYNNLLVTKVAMYYTYSYM
jgi:hypothetical protein